MTDTPDIFISYADADADWTRSWLLPKLEAQGLRVTSATDLLAGGARIEQIAQEAERSKHTLLVLSPDWVASQWETFTGLISHSTDPVGRQRRTIPLLRRVCEPPRSIARLVSADFASDKPSDWEKQLSRLLAVLSGQQYRTALGPPLGALMGAEAPTNFKFRQNEHFVGREQELAEIHELLDDAAPLGVNAARASSRAAGLTGLGGVGKTQLVVEYIHRYGRSYPGGIFWINAADGVADDFAEIGRVISGNGHEKTPDELIRISYDYLRSDPEILLVVDNLNEPSLLNQEVVGILTPISLPCRLLFTTRRRDLRGLRSIAVDMLKEPDALKLLLRSRLAIMDSNHPEHPMAIKLCATLGGLPLAIEMAAAFLEQEKDIPLSGYLKRLGKEGSLQTLDTLEQAKDWSPTWHDPIQVTLESQWEALTSAEARLLLQAAALMREAAVIPEARLGLLTGLSPVAEEGYSSPLASALRRLYNYSLIEMLEGNQVRLHPLVREFVRTSIAKLDEFSLQCSTNMATALKDMLRVHKEISERGVDALLADIKFGLNLSRNNNSLEELLLVLDKEAHNLRQPFGQLFASYNLQQIRKRAFSLDKTALLERVENALNSLKTPWFRERFPSKWESTALLRTFGGYTESVMCVAISADGKQAIANAARNKLLLWDIESGQSLHTLEGHTDRVGAVAISADGKRAVSGSADNTLRVWNLESGQSLHTLEGHADRVDGVAISADGKKAISGSADKTVRVWNLESEQSLHILGGHTDRVRAVAISADGKRAVSGSADNTLRVWDVESGRSLRILEEPTGSIICVGMSADGKRVASGSWEKTVQIWDIESGLSLCSLVGHRQAVVSVALSSDGNRAVSSSMDGTVQVWDVENGKSLCILEGHASIVWCVAITADCRRAVSGSADKTVRVWNIETEKNTHASKNYSQTVTSVALTADSKRAISGSTDKTVRVWDVQSGRILRVLQGHRGSVTSVAISADGQRAVSSAENNTFRVWEVATPEYYNKLYLWRLEMNWLQHLLDFQNVMSLHTSKGHTDTIMGVAISADGKRAISGSWDKTVRVWDVESGQKLCTLEEHADRVTSVAISADGKRAVSGSANTLRAWDIESGLCLHTFEGHTNTVWCVAIAADGKRAVSGSADNTLRVWDIERGLCLHTLEGHTDGVHCVALTTDGKRAVSSSTDNTLRLWNLATGQASLIFAGEGYTRFALNKTGRLIVIGSLRGSLQFIDYVGEDNRM